MNVHRGIANNKNQDTKALNWPFSMSIGRVGQAIESSVSPNVCQILFSASCQALNLYDPESYN